MSNWTTPDIEYRTVKGKNEYRIKRNLLSLPERNFEEPLKSSEDTYELEEPEWAFCCDRCEGLEFVIYTNGHIVCANEDCNSLIGSLGGFEGVE